MNIAKTLAAKIEGYAETGATLVPVADVRAAIQHMETLEALIRRSMDREYNPFEPDNQSKLYYDLRAAIAPGAV